MEIKNMLLIWSPADIYHNE